MAIQIEIERTAYARMVQKAGLTGDLPNASSTSQLGLDEFETRRLIIPLPEDLDSLDISFFFSNEEDHFYDSWTYEIGDRVLESVRFAIFYIYDSNGTEGGAKIDPHYILEFENYEDVENIFNKLGSEAPGSTDDVFPVRNKNINTKSSERILTFTFNQKNYSIIIQSNELNGNALIIGFNQKFIPANDETSVNELTETTQALLGFIYKELQKELRNVTFKIEGNNFDR